MSDTLHIDRGDSPWQGFTSSYEEEQRGKQVAAVAFDPAFEPPRHLTEFGPLLAIDRAARRVVVNAAYFSPISRADATRQTPGARHQLGRCTDPDLLAAPARLARFLVLSELVETYWHVGAELRATDDPAPPDHPLHRTHFTGHHEYYTNSHHQAPLTFTIEIDRTTGTMTLAT